MAVIAGCIGTPRKLGEERAHIRRQIGQEPIAPEWQLWQWADIVVSTSARADPTVGGVISRPSSS